MQHTEEINKYDFLRFIKKEEIKKRGCNLAETVDLIEIQLANLTNLSRNEEDDNHYVNFFEVTCSLARLDLAVISYFDDMHRYKDYHNMLLVEERVVSRKNQKELLESQRVPNKINREIAYESNVNFAKIFTYTTKWILKYQPFFLTIHDDKIIKDDNGYKVMYDYDVSINQRVLLTWISNVVFAQTKKKFIIPPKDFDYFLYVTKYRYLDLSSLEFFFEKILPHSLLSKENV